MQCVWKNLLLPLAAVLVSFSQIAARQPVSSAREWRGQELKAGHGVISFEALLLGAMNVARKSHHDELAIRVRHLGLGKTFSIKQPFAAKADEHRFVYWTLPAGRYQIETIHSLQNRKMHFWTGTSAKVFTVPKTALADLGVWKVRSGLGDKLQVDFATNIVQAFMLPPNGRKMLTAVTDGFTARALQLLGGERGARSVTMQYQMKVRPVRPAYDTIMSAFKKREHRFRQCYLAGLDGNSRLQGTAEFHFSLVKGTGAVEALRHQGGTLRDRQTITCLLGELAQVGVPIKEQVSGSLSFDFSAN